MPSSDAAPRLTLDELKARLDDIFYLDIVSGRSYERLLDALTLERREVQDFALHWGEVGARADPEVGYLTIQLAPQALRAMAPALAERWALAALDHYDREGVRAAVAALRGFAGYAQQCAEVGFERIESRLARFVQGLSGRPLQVAVGDNAWTDSATIHLPPAVSATDVVGCYKALAALCWAQTRYGTFAASVEAALAATGDAERAAAWLALLEAQRLAARLMHELPGLGAALREIVAELPPELGASQAVLAGATATVDDSLACLPRLMHLAPPADAPFGALRVALALRVRAERAAADRLVLRKAIAALMKSHGGKGGDGESELALVMEGQEPVLTIDGEVVTLPPEARAAAQSLALDLGEIPPECLTPAGPGAWTPTEREGESRSGTMETHADALYDEWDYRRRAYRRQWCHLFLRDPGAGEPDYVADVRRRHAPLIRQLRRRFEALRGEDRMLKRQADGAEVDIDALVASIANRRGGAEHDERLFMRRERNERSLAAAFMVDMSGSTKGWVNEAEREALVMLCEALEALGDRYAIWGFSGWTRTRCEVYRIKEFDDAYDDRVRARIAAIEAKDYTRMGPPIRHLTRRLLAQPAKHRLLVTLSDGRPDDFGDEYRGQYGVEDTRQALLEARQAGVRAYCVTIDRHGADYLRHMYGPASYTVLADVRKLPLRIADIYRRLTT